MKLPGVTRYCPHHECSKPATPKNSQTGGEMRERWKGAFACVRIADDGVSKLMLTAIWRKRGWKWCTVRGEIWYRGFERSWESVNLEGTHLRSMWYWIRLRSSCQLGRASSPSWGSLSLDKFRLVSRALWTTDRKIYGWLISSHEYIYQSTFNRNFAEAFGYRCCVSKST